MNNQNYVIKRLPHDYDSVVAKLIFIVPGTDPVVFYCCVTRGSFYHQCKNVTNGELFYVIGNRTFYICADCWNGPQQYGRKWESMMQDKLMDQQAADEYARTPEYQQNLAREKAVALDKKRKYVFASVKLRADTKVIRQADTEVSKSRKKFKNAALSHKRAVKKRRLNEQEDDELCRQNNLRSREDPDSSSDEDEDEDINLDSPLSRMTMNGSLKNGGRG